MLILPLTYPLIAKVVELINSAPEDIRPKVFVSAIDIGYYGTSETQVFDEQSSSGNDYLAKLIPLFKMFVGGPIGSGK